MRLPQKYEEVSYALSHSSDTVAEKLLERMSDLSHQLDVTGSWDRDASAKAVLDRLGLDDMEAKVGTLFGGQRKRVALARPVALG